MYLASNVDNPKLRMQIVIFNDSSYFLQAVFLAGVSPLHLIFLQFKPNEPNAVKYCTIGSDLIGGVFVLVDDSQIKQQYQRALASEFIIAILRFS